MTIENKKLLLKDLCARLPHKPFVQYPNDVNAYGILEVYYPTEEQFVVNGELYETEDIKPYLRPLSSMTDEEEEEYNVMSNYNNSPTNSFILVDWLNEHHFDCRNLIEKGLAIDCTNLNIY